MATPDFIYYAHPVSWYGTPDEQADVFALQEFGTVVNPNSDYFERQVEYAKRKERPVMDIFANYIQHSATVVAFRRFTDGLLGAGVAREVFEAVIWGKKVYEITNDENGVRWVAEVVNPAMIVGGVATVAETKARIERKEL